MGTQKADRGSAQKEDALKSMEKATKKQSQLRATPHLKEKQASMKRDHPKYRASYLKHS